MRVPCINVPFPEIFQSRLALLTDGVKLCAFGASFPLRSSGHLVPLAAWRSPSPLGVSLPRLATAACLAFLCRAPLRGVWSLLSAYLAESCFFVHFLCFYMPFGAKLGKTAKKFAHMKKKQ